jgi:ABC-type bacteriocin/lantibiotic exporter with double-glycine peptidase domain
VPASLGRIVDHLDKSKSAAFSGTFLYIWLPVVIYAALTFISSSACLGWIRKWLWLPVEQYGYEAISTAAHAHIMSLSSDFHDSKASSELTQAISGGRSVANLLDTVLFQIVPMLIDLAVAFGYLTYMFGPYMGLILGVEAIVYLYTTTKLIELNADARREYIKSFRKEWTVAQQYVPHSYNAKELDYNETLSYAV